jgi:hypothetical protein
MSGRTRALILTLVIGLVLTITVGTAGASRHVSDKLRKSVAAHALANVGRPPVVGGPYGDPGDYPGLVGSTLQGIDSASAVLSPNFGAQDDCRDAQPGSAC